MINLRCAHLSGRISCALRPSRGRKKPCYGRVGLRKRPILHIKVPRTNYLAAERRAAPRIYGPFAALLLDADPVCQKQVIGATLDDLSAGGFHLRVTRPPEQGEKLSVVTQVSRAVLILHGLVLRVDPQKDGSYGLAAAVVHYKIFSLPEAGK